MPTLHRSAEEETAPHLSLKTRLYAWWEGYDLSGLKGRHSHGDDDDGPAGLAAHGHPVVPRPAAGEHGEPAPRTGELNRHGKPLWSASRIQVAEKIWGDGFVTPGGHDHIPYLCKPLGLTPAMSALDLSAGLGGTVRIMAGTFGAWATGLEPSPALAEEGMARSVKAGLAQKATVEHFDPEHFDSSRRFDCVFAKESFYTVANKESLMDGVVACIKSPGHLLFTDYVIDANPSSPAVIKNWTDHEPLVPHPWTVEQWSACLKKHRLDVRIAEDITDTHAHLILTAIKALTSFLEDHSLDRATKLNVVDEVELWARRVAALHGGLRCYRFHALKS